MKLYIHGGTDKNKSIPILTQHLTKLKHTVQRELAGAEGVICWGSSINTDLPVLNAKVNQFNKMTALKVFHSKRVPAPTVMTLADLPRGHYPVPYLARKIAHKCGKDIVAINSRLQAEKWATRRDFYVPFIPTKTEYRVWSLGDKVMSVYEKLWKGEGEYTGIQRNHRFGFHFEKRDDLRKSEMSSWAIQAVKALGMDFGATDIIESKEGEFFVLEVNSMPAIDSPTKSSGIRLAKQIHNFFMKSED